MYLDYFGLKKMPFGITPDTSLFFNGAERGDVLDAILYALNAGEGIIKVVGEVGSGKTMLSRMLTKQAPDNTVFVYLLNPSIQAEEVLYAIAYELELEIDASEKSIKTLHLLQLKLFELYQAGKKVVLVVDEAQQMPLATLEEIRLLSNLETETEKLIQIILFGQPELDEHIDAASVRQLRERITYSFYLSALSWEVADNYLNFRLGKAGHHGRAIFNPAAIKLLTKYSDGTLRRLNVLADKSLLAAFLENSPVVSVKHVKKALKDNTKGHKKSRAISYVLLAVVASFLLAAIGYYYSEKKSLEATVVQKNAAKIVPPSANDAGMEGDVLRVKPEVKDVDKAQEEHANAQGGLLKERILAFNNWRAQTNEGVYTIRLMSAPSSSKNRVEQFVRSVTKKLDKKNIFIKKTSKGAYIVYYQRFVGYSKASKALSNLPMSVQKFAPYIFQINE